MIPTTNSVAETWGDLADNQGNELSLAERNRLMQWRSAIQSFLSKVTSTIGEASIPVVWATDAKLQPRGGKKINSVAWTDGSSIFINPEYFSSDMRDPIIKSQTLSIVDPLSRLKGVAYHELAHILWTPRMRSEPTSTIVMMEGTTHPGIFRIFNALEDQRIESLFAAQWTPARPYFTDLALKFILTPDYSKVNDDGKYGKQVSYAAHTLTHGRKFLPLSIREACRQAFADRFGAKIEQQVSSIIDEYRVLLFPASAAKAVTLVTKMYALLVDGGIGLPPDTSGQEGGSGNHEGLTSGRTRPAAKQREDQEVLSEQDAEDDDADNASAVEVDGDESTDGGDDDGTGNDTTFKGDGDEGTSSKGAASLPSNDSDEGGTGSSSDAIGNGSGDTNESGNGVTHGDSTDALGQVLSDVLSAIENAKQDMQQAAMDDLKSIRASMDQGVRPSLRPDLRGATKYPVEPAMRGASAGIERAIRQVWADAEDEWVHGQSSGRLNVNAVMSSRGTHFDVFDQWSSDGDDATSFEVVVLVDQSSSMGGWLQHETSKVLWILRRAFAGLDIPMTVYGYDDHSRLLFGPSSSVNNATYDVVATKGGTNPVHALQWATQVLMGSQAKHRMLFSLTDGQWGWYSRVQEVMEMVNDKDIHSYFLRLTGRSHEGTRAITDKKDRYWHDRGMTISDLKKFSELMAKEILALSNNYSH